MSQIHREPPTETSIEIRSTRWYSGWSHPRQREQPSAIPLAIRPSYIIDCRGIRSNLGQECLPIRLYVWTRFLYHRDQGLRVWTTGSTEILLDVGFSHQQQYLPVTHPPFILIDTNIGIILPLFTLEKLLIH